MIVTAETYRQAAQRLQALAQAPEAPFAVNTQAGLWALQFDGAAEALEHHTHGDYDRGYEQGWNNREEELDPELTGMKDAIWTYFDLLDSPSPTYREKATDALRDCARDLQII